MLRPLEPGVPYSTTLSAVASKVDGTVSPSAFAVVQIFGHANAALEVDRELEFGDLIEGDLSRVCAVQDGVSGFELEVAKMLQVYVIEAVKIPLSGSVAGFAGDIACSAPSPLPARSRCPSVSMDVPRLFPSPRQQVLFRDPAVTPTRKPQSGASAKWK